MNATFGVNPAAAHCLSRCSRHRSQPAIQRCPDSRARSAGQISVTAGAISGSPLGAEGMIRCTASDSSTCSRMSPGSAAAGSASPSSPASPSGSCRKTSATSTYPARSMRTASGGSASVSRRSTLGCRSRSIAAAAGTIVPSADGNAASRSRPARMPL